MTIDELKQVVAKIQLGDNRQVDRLVLEFWWELIGNLHFEDAKQAVNFHRLEQPGKWLEPGHVVAGSKRARDIRERETRRNQPAIESAQITLDREQFERETAAAIEVARAARASIPHAHKFIPDGTDISCRICGELLQPDGDN